MTQSRDRRRNGTSPPGGPPTGSPARAVRVAIDGLAWGGDGVGRVGGKVIFVPLTAPGDVADVVVTADRGSFLNGRLRALARMSPVRVPPPCPVYGTCGGCQWQHVSLDAQLDAKRTILLQALVRIGKITLPGSVDIVPSPLAYGYRHRTKLQVESGGGSPKIGFFQAATHRIVPVERCLLLQESLNSLLPSLGDILADFPRLTRETASLLLATDFSGRLVRVAFRGRRKATAPPGEAIRRLSGAAGRSGLEILVAGATDGALPLGPSPDDLQAPGECFTQVNLALNRKLVREVLRLASPSEGEEALDLFCGTGNFSIPISSRGAKVVGVDTSGPALRCAGENARRLGVPLELRRARAESATVGFAARGRKFDLVVLNPPRTGASEAVTELRALAPSRIVMVSCNPATFARDAATIVSFGYRLAELTAFDLFPQTFHFESVGLFLR